MNVGFASHVAPASFTEFFRCFQTAFSFGRQAAEVGKPLHNSPILSVLVAPGDLAQETH